MIDHNHHSHNSDGGKAQFDRSEMVLGDLLGKGAFCHVHELQDVRLVKRTRPNHHNNQSGHHQNYSPTSTTTSCRRWSASTRWLWRSQETASSSNRIRDEIRQTCQDEEGNARYVIKHLRPNLANERSHKVFVHAAADLVMEYEILSRLSHPNIVTLRGCGDSGGDGTATFTTIDYQQHFFLVLDKVEATLTQRIHFWKLAGGLPSSLPKSQHGRQLRRTHTYNHPYYEEKLQYAREMVSALSYIHEQRLLFRDLKPDNVGIVDGTIKLFDFGLCRELPRITSSNEVHGKNDKEPLFRMSGVGTRRYMSPEMVLGYGYNQKVDCYSWAMVFYEMLSLQKPYSSYNREVHRILVCENEERPYPTVDIPLPARALLEQAWAQDPHERLSMKEIHNALGPMIETAKRQAMTPEERSLNAVIEMADLLVAPVDFGGSGNPHDHVGGGSSVSNSVFSRKSTAELTASTATSASTEASLLLGHNTPPAIFC